MVQWGFTTVAAGAAPMRAGFTEVAQAPSEPVRAGFSTTTGAGEATSWGFASVPAMPSHASPPVAARGSSDTGTR